MEFLDGSTLASLKQAFLGILSYALKKAIATSPLLIVDERLVDQAGEEVEYLPLINPRTHTDGLRSLHRPSPHEDGEAVQQHLFLLTEKVITPIDRRLKGLMTRQRCSTTPC